MAKTCRNCGFNNRDHDQYCAHCGRALDGSVDKYDAFLSYRRESGGPLALFFQTELSKSARNVFVDVTAPRAGRFAKRLLDTIEKAEHFIVLLTPGSLDRCKDKGDWLAREICHAIKCNKNIIPVITAGFEYPSSMDDFPEEMREFDQYHAIKFDSTLVRETIRQILEFMPKGDATTAPRVSDINNPPENAPYHFDKTPPRTPGGSPGPTPYERPSPSTINSHQSDSNDPNTGMLETPTPREEQALPPVQPQDSLLEDQLSSNEIAADHSQIPRYLAIGLLVAAAALGSVTEYLAKQISTETIEVGSLSKNLVELIKGSATKKSALVATDASLRSATGKPVLELSRIYVENEYAGAFGRNWQPLIPYTLKPGSEKTAILGNSALAPASMTIKNYITGERHTLKLDSEKGTIGYVGPGLEPWQRLNIQSNGGLYLTDGEESEFQFNGAPRIIALIAAGVRWIFHYWDDKLVVIESLPHEIKLGAEGGKQTATIVDALQPITMKIKSVEDGLAEFLPRESGRWEKLYVAEDGGSAKLIDRWGFSYSFRDLDKFSIMNSEQMYKAPKEKTTGFILHYDKHGRVTRVDVGKSGQVRYEYDDQDRLLAVTGLEGVRREYDYSNGDNDFSQISLPSRKKTCRNLGYGSAGILVIIGSLIWWLNRRREEAA